jgi:glycosyltransferase involved in cell wall biosynthesis
VRAAHAAAPGAAVYVVDDGSDDGTAAAAQAAGAAVLALSHGGKGAALAAGVARALDDGADVLVTLDADGQHPPADVPRLAAPVREGSADVVLGARARTRAMPLLRRFNNWASGRLVSRVAGYAIPDAQTGFRAFSRRVAAAIRPVAAGYDYELVFLLDALHAGFRVSSVAVPTIYDGAVSHFHPVRDTWSVASVFARNARWIARAGKGPR